MTIREPISAIQNRWFDSEQVDNDDLNTEQNYNTIIQSSIIGNHIGSGVLPTILEQNILFDSLLVSGFLDGYGLSVQQQPSDTSFGNQLEITLINSRAAGKRTVKIAVIGLDFQGNLQYDTFVFKANETQYTKKHYTNIATILVNDVSGPILQSFNLGGQILIKEAFPLTISRDPIMVAQDIEPNLFFRDFFPGAFLTLAPLLQSALPLYNVDNLGISIGFKTNQILSANDVTTQIGEKFLATTNNIQKVTLLLSVQNTNVSTDLSWHGDLVISIYPLQSVLDCPTDIVPNLAIEFPPSNIPLTQLSVAYADLQALGIQLDGTPQPIDFIFSNTSVANGTTVIPNQFYAVTVKRSGAADKCDILIATGSNHIANSRVTVFTGSDWVDIPEDNLWFRVYTDAAKITDGQAYETGHGVVVPKTIQDPITNVQEDYNLGAIQFNGNGINTAVLQATTQLTTPIQDQRTGNPVFSRQQFIPTIQLYNSIDIASLESVSEPLTLGVIVDSNQKTIDVSASTIAAQLHSWNFVKNQFIIKVITDTSNPRYDINVTSLVSNFVDGDFTDAKIIPDLSHPNIYYRIAKAQLCSMIYGDVNGDGVVDDNDITALNKLLGTNLSMSPPATSQITTNNINTTVVNGYEMFVNPFVPDFSLAFQLVDPLTTNVIAFAADGQLVPNPNDPSLATFESLSTDFSLVSNLTNLNLVIYGTSNQQNDGYFTILNIDVSSNHILDIQKLYYDADIFKQIYRADIDGDFDITANDGYLLQSYVNRSGPFPPVAQPSLKIGTSFDTLTIIVDPFLYNDVPTDGYFDRTDDFPFNQVNRNATLHTQQDIFLNDGYLQSHDFLGIPVSFNIVKQLSWEETLITTAADARFVPAAFTSETGLVINNCSPTGVTCETYPTDVTYNPGLNNLFIPNNLIIGDGGNLLNSDGYFYKVDFEIGTVVLEIPPGLMGTESTVNVFDAFVADYTGGGITRLGFRAMKYSDCSFVGVDAIFNNQVRFDVSMQSVSPQLDGYTFDGYSGDIIDDKSGVSIDYTTGVLKLNFTNLYQDPVLQTLNTKVQVQVFLKKAGFNNTPLIISSDKVLNIFNST